MASTKNIIKNSFFALFIFLATNSYGQEPKKAQSEQEKIEAQQRDLIPYNFIQQNPNSKISKIALKYLEHVEKEKLSEDNINYRDLFIESVIDVALKETIKSGVSAIPVVGKIAGPCVPYGLWLSAQAEEQSNYWRQNVMPHMPKWQSSGTWQDAQIRKAYISQQMLLDAAAIPYKTFELVKSKLTNYFGEKLDQAGITDEKIAEIANRTHSFITQKAPDYIKKSYNKLLDSSVDLSNYFSNKTKQAVATTKAAGSGGAQALKNIFRSHELDEKFDHHLRLLRQKIDEVGATHQELRKLEGARLQREQIEAIQKRIEKERQAVHQVSSDITQGFSTIAHMAGDYRTARAIQGFGSGAVKILDNLMLMNQNAMHALASVAGGASTIANLAGAAGPGAAALSLQPWIGVGVGVLTIASAIMDSQEEEGPNPIMEGLLSISNKLDTYYAHIISAIEDIDKHLYDQDRMMLQNFFELHKGQKNIQQELSKIYNTAQQQYWSLQGSFEHVNHVLKRNHQTTLNNLHSLREETIQELIHEALDASKKSTLSIEKFQEYISKLTIRACISAKHPTLTGGAIVIGSNHDVQNALDKQFNIRNIWTHPVFSNVNLIRRIAFPRSEPLVNPLIWMKCTEAIIEMLNKKIDDPNYQPNQDTLKLDLAKLEALRQEGRRLRQFIKAAGRTGVIGKLRDDISETVQRLEECINFELGMYENNRTGEIQNAHKTFIESEIVALQTNANNCGRCANLTSDCAKRIRNNSNHWNAQCTDKNTGWNMNNGRFAFRGNTGAPEFSEIRNSQMPSSAEYLAQLKKEHINNVKQNLHKQLVLTKVQLTNPHSTTYAQTQVAHPKDKDHYKVILMLPKDVIPACARYCEYNIEIAGNEPYFFLRAYESDMPNPKQLVYVTKLKYEQSTLYNNEENLLHFWYGGRYPKNEDLFKGNTGIMIGNYPPITPYPAARDRWTKNGEIVKSPRHLEFERQNLFENGAKEINALVLAYLGQECDREKLEFEKQNLFRNSTKEINTLVFEYLGQESDREKDAIEFQAKERRAFTNKLIALTVPSSNSQIFALLEELHTRLVLLQSMVVFMYNESMYANNAMLPEFAELFNQNILLKNREAFIAYLKDYAQEDNKGAERPYELLKLLEQANLTLEQTITRIVGIFKPSFDRNTEILYKLKELIAVYRNLRLTNSYEFRQFQKSGTMAGAPINVLKIIEEYLEPKAVTKKPAEELVMHSQHGKYMASSTGERDQQISALISSNMSLKAEISGLKESNAKLESTVATMQTQFATFSKQIELLTALLVAQSKK